MYYTGIGSRKTPRHILDTMTDLAASLSGNATTTLRSGGAHGADLAFQLGAIRKEIYLPWNGFNGFIHNNLTLIDSCRMSNKTEAAVIASKFHPRWSALNRVGKLMMTRNVYQILGQDLNTPSDVVICWTADGATIDTTIDTTKDTGGTGQALRIATHHSIPIYNLARLEDLNIIRTWIK